jgi:hypothetical protein
MPTRQPFSRASGEPRLEASRVTSGVFSTTAGTGRAWAWPPNKVPREGGGGGWGWDGWANPCRTKQKAKAASFIKFRRKNPPYFNVFSTLIQTGRSSKKIASGLERPGIPVDTGSLHDSAREPSNYSSQLVPKRRILASKQWSEAAGSGAVLEVGSWKGH